MVFLQRELVVVTAMSFEARMASRGLRAAQYVRMSTDHQKYSIDNQIATIAKYAAERNIAIVRTYKDEGRSGLLIVGRDGLKELIADVQLGFAAFDCILVYDISRWGRFQDVDESAYYEFICRRAGIQVHYCAEEFENDGSLSSTVLKTVKRLAAADYSRQLSTRIFIAQCHMTELGFWRGGKPGYGLRRLLVDEHGTPKLQLEYGQHKYLQTDHVLVRPGPVSELKIVRRIFHSFVSQGKTPTEIAAGLNTSQVRTDRGNSWSCQAIIKILNNEAYIGNIVFNRASYKLKQRAILNPPDMWVRHNGALDPVVSPKIFSRAQEIMAKRRQRLTDQEALDQLRALWRKKGRLSHKIIIASDEVLDTSTLRARFGSLSAVYSLIGFRPKPRYRWLQLEQKIRSIVNAAVDEMVLYFKGLQVSAAFDDYTRILTLGELSVSVGSARCIANGERTLSYWRIRTDRCAATDLTLIARMDLQNIRIEEYYLLPTTSFTEATVRKPRLSSPVFSKSCRYDRFGTLTRALHDEMSARGGRRS